ncbi:MAG: thioredoxin family protein [Odoribacter sp.]|nr:thioredoxin family protein [Odoribacter sp.]
MKRILFILIGIVASASAFAQTGVRFLDNEPWAKVVKQAKKEKKLIFVDCYTSWCGPCKQLATQIFPQKQVGDFINARFVSVKYDMEKEAGLAFGQKYPGEVKAYPTMLIIDTEGKLIHKFVGSQPAEELLNNIEEGLKGNTIYVLEEKYRQGNRESEFIKKYLAALNNVSDKEKYEEVACAYAATFPMDSLLNAELWRLMEHIVVNKPYSKEYRFVVEHLDEYRKRGFDRYDLENRLSDAMGFATNMLFLEAIRPEKDYTTKEALQKINDLRILCRNSVKGFPESSAELAVIECIFTENWDEIFNRLWVLTDAGLVKRSYFQVEACKQFIQHSADKQQLQACVNYLLPLQKKTSGWEKEIVDEAIALVNEKIGNNH